MKGSASPLSMSCSGDQPSAPVRPMIATAMRHEESPARLEFVVQSVLDAAQRWAHADYADATEFEADAALADAVRAYETALAAGTDGEGH